jgi:hypothetical protein
MICLTVSKGFMQSFDAERLLHSFDVLQDMGSVGPKNHIISRDTLEKALLKFAPKQFPHPSHAENLLKMVRT